MFERKSNKAPEICVIAQVYSRECPEGKWGSHPDKQPTKSYGLVAMDFVKYNFDDQDKKSKTYLSKK